MGALGALLGFYILGFEVLGQRGYDFLNITGPCALTAILGLGAYRMARADPSAIWTSILWFRVATGAYFGFGNVFPFIANTTTKLYFDEWFFAQPWHYYKLNLIVTVSALLVLGSASAVMAAGRPQPQTRVLGEDQFLLLLGLVFAAIGICVKLFIILPSALWAAENNSASGSLVALEVISPVSIYILTRYAMLHRRAVFFLVALVGSVEILSSLILFSKYSTLMSVMMFAFAFLSTGVRTWKVALSIAFVFMIFFYDFPLVNFAREELARRGNQAGLDERLRIIGFYASHQDPLALDEDVQSISRLSYVYESAFAIDQYDSGRPGDSLDNAWVVLIPRFLWPGKPVISDIGARFTLTAGAPDNLTAPGIFADAYWDFGWLGVLGLMIPIGFLLGVTSRYAVGVLASGSWMQFPAVVSALKMGIRVDGFIIVDYAGAAVITLALYILCKCAERVVHPLVLGNGRIRQTAVPPAGLPRRF